MVGATAMIAVANGVAVNAVANAAGAADVTVADDAAGVTAAGATNAARNVVQTETRIAFRPTSHAASATT